MIDQLNKVKFCAILFTLAILIPLTGFDFSEKKDAPGVSATPNKKTYSPGESGVITISFKTGSKVKIPKDPEVTINLTSDDVQGQGMQDYYGDEGDYINGSKVKYNFSVPEGAASGSTLTVSGSVKFGYCTTSDGVCRLASKNFSTKIKVK